MEDPRIRAVTPLDGLKLLVQFENHVLKVYDAENLTVDYDFFAPLRNPEIFCQAYPAVGGHGVIWDEKMDISEWDLWEKGIEVPLSENDFRLFVENNTVSTSEACQILDCSRQNIDRLVKDKKLIPVRELGNNKLFARSDLMAYRAKIRDTLYWEKYSTMLSDNTETTG